MDFTYNLIRTTFIFILHSDQLSVIILRSISWSCWRHLFDGLLLSPLLEHRNDCVALQWGCRRHVFHQLDRHCENVGFALRLFYCNTYSCHRGSGNQSEQWTTMQAKYDLKWPAQKCTNWLDHSQWSSWMALLYPNCSLNRSLNRKMEREYNRIENKTKKEQEKTHRNMY